MNIFYTIFCCWKTCIDANNLFLYLLIFTIINTLFVLRFEKVAGVGRHKKKKFSTAGFDTDLDKVSFTIYIHVVVVYQRACPFISFLLFHFSLSVYVYVFRIELSFSILSPGSQFMVRGKKFTTFVLSVPLHTKFLFSYKPFMK